MDNTIIIVTFNSGEILERCIKTIDDKYPVLVIENSNNSELKNKIENKYKNVNFFLSKENMGYGKANNFGVNKAQTKYALILNPDTQLKKNTIDNLISCSRQIPDFALIAPKIIDENQKKTEVEEINNKNFSEVSIIKGFAILLNKEVMVDIGLFDENFFLYFEEIDLCKRVLKNDKKIFLAHDAEVSHEGGSSHVKEINKEMELSRNWHYMWSKFYFYKKHYGFIYSLAHISPNFFSSIIKFLLFTITFQEEKKQIYYHRMSGIYNSIMGRKAWFRPKF